MRAKTAARFAGVVVVMAALGCLCASTAVRPPLAGASTPACTGAVVDVGQARGTISIHPWWYLSSGVFLNGKPLDALGTSYRGCGTVTIADNVANASLTLALPSESVVTLSGSSMAQVEVAGVTYAFSTGLFSTIASGGSSTLVVGAGVGLIAAAGPTGITIGGTLFDESFTTLRGNGSATRTELSGTGDLSLSSTPGSASFGTLNILGVTGGFIGTSSTQALLPSVGSPQLSVADTEVSVTLGSTSIPLFSFGAYAAQGSAPTSFATDGSLDVVLVGDGSPSSLTFRGPGPGVIDFESASSGTATSTRGAATITTTFSRMGHVASSWQATPSSSPVIGESAPAIATIPPAPIAVVATVPNAATDRAVITWDEPGNDESPVTSWTVVALDLTSGATGPTVQVKGSDTSATVSGLIAGDAYAFEVIATNALGTGSASVPSNSVVPLGVTAKVHRTAVSTSASGVASSSIASSSPTAPSLAVHAHGQGSVTLGVYPSDPISASGTKSIAKSGTIVHSYFDVSVAPSSTFSSLSFIACNMSAGYQVMWWDPTAQKLLPVSVQTPISGPNMCISARITPATRPSLDDLFGTVFAAATPKAYADATSPGSFWVLSFNGQVERFGNAKTYGSVAWRQAGELEPFVAISPSIDAKGYLVVSRSGVVLAFGDAKTYGSVADLHLKNASRIEIISITRTEDGKGYWLASSSGNVFAFGDAKFYGSASAALGSRPSTVISAMARTPDGKGYWLVSNSGEVFAFGDAAHLGSATHASGIVGIASPQGGNGYLLVSRTGVVYPFGDVRSYSSSRPLPAAAIIGITATADGKGYYLVSANGAVLPFGDARAKQTAPSTYVVSAITTP